jgi:hypothetical protein
MHPELVESSTLSLSKGACLLRFDKLSAHDAELLLAGVRE